MNIIIGKKSRLSSALLALPEMHKDVVCLETKSAEYELAKFDKKEVKNVFCVGAITDPSVEKKEIENINIKLPIAARKRFSNI